MQTPTTLRFSSKKLCKSYGLPLLLLMLMDGCLGFGQASPAGAAGGASRPMPVGAPTFNGPPNQPTGAPSPTEYAAFASAMSTTPAQAQAAALQVFLQSYPQSSLAPQARNWLLAARTRAGKPRAAISPSPGTAAPGPAAPPAAAATAAPQRAYSAAASQPSRRAVIDLSSHSLTIHADNSSLSQILRDLSTYSGMKVEGLTRDERIYGSFGPGEPQDVLTSLVDGLGYNILMLGSESRGVPHELILTPRVAGPGGQAADAAPQNADADQDEDADDQSATPDIQPPQGRPFTPGPPPTPGQNGRTTEQMLEELRRMHPQGGPQVSNPPNQPQ